MKALRMITLVLVLLVSITVGGVYATWTYAELATDAKSDSLTVSVGDFGETMHEGAELGQDHDALIENIISGDSIGLNTADSYLNEQISARQNSIWGAKDTIGSMAVNQGDELNELFGTNTSNLEFLVQTISDTEIYLFTTSIDLGERGTAGLWGNSTPGSPNIPIGQPIYEINRTVVQLLDGVWTRIITERGYATSAWYEESQPNYRVNVTQIPSFNPDTWMPGTRGASMSEAIWVYAGYADSAECNGSSVWYTVKPTSATIYTVTSANTYSTIEIRNASGTLISSATATASGATATFTASANTQYYIVITCPAESNVTVS